MSKHAIGASGLARPAPAEGGAGRRGGCSSTRRNTQEREHPSGGSPGAKTHPCRIGPDVSSQARPQSIGRARAWGLAWLSLSLSRKKYEGRLASPAPSVYGSTRRERESSRPPQGGHLAGRPICDRQSRPAVPRRKPAAHGDPKSCGARARPKWRLGHEEKRMYASVPNHYGKRSSPNSSKSRGSGVSFFKLAAGSRRSQLGGFVGRHASSVVGRGRNT